MHPPHARSITSLAIALAIALTACTPNNNAVTSVTIDGGDRTIVLGDPLTLTATITTTGTADDAITWTSSSQTVATIDANGTVTTVTDGTTDLTATSLFDPTRSDTITLTIDPPGALRWTRQFGTTGNEVAFGVATDASGNAFVTGYTTGDLESPSVGGFDVYLRAYDPDGNLRWTRQFGTNGNDAARGVATDAIGNVYVSGYTNGDLEGTSAGGSDGFLRAYDPNGTALWTRQFGTSSSDAANDIASDANGNVYVAGYTTGDLEGPNAGSLDVFLRAYDADGDLRWARQFGTSAGDTALGVATDADGNVYVSGSTSGDLEGATAGTDDAFLRAYDADGNLRWTRQYGSGAFDYGDRVATDANGNVYVSGYTSGDLVRPNAGGFDAFLRAYDPDGTHRWTDQFGTGGDDSAQGVATEANGNVYVSAYTNGALDGPNAGGFDAVLRAYDADGNVRWARQYGTAGDELTRDVAAAPNGTTYVAGDTTGDLDGTNAGGTDAFLRSFGR